MSLLSYYENSIIPMFAAIGIVCIIISVFIAIHPKLKVALIYNTSYACTQKDQTLSGDNVCIEYTYIPPVKRTIVYHPW